MTKKIINLLVFLFVCFLVFNAADPAWALGIKISPPIIEPLVQPGSTYNDSLKVTNDSSESITLYPYIRDFEAQGEEGTARLVDPGTEKDGISAWLNMDTSSLDFQPGETKAIPFSIVVPENASPGGHYGAIVVGTRAPDLKINTEDKGAAIATAQEVASLILVQISGEMDVNADIREFKTDRSFYNSPFQISFSTRIENKGNIHIKPRGEIKITDMFGKTVTTLDLNKQGSNVLPQTMRKFNNEWKEKGGYGRYKASLALSYGVSADNGGTGMQSLFSEVTFWIIPWRTIIPTVLGLIFIASLLVIWLKFYKSKAIKKAMQQMGYNQQVKYVRKVNGASPAVHFGLILMTILVIVFLIGMVIYFIFFA